MSDSPFITTATLEDFEQKVITASLSQPVLVDFWAGWCEPCKTLMPMLDKLVEEYNGGFLLVKVDTDANQDLAMQLGIRSLPTVMMFKGGQPVDQFMGAIPESQIREFLDKHVTAVEGGPVNLHEQARAALDAGELEAAQQLLQQAIEADPQNLDIKLDIVEYLIASKQNADALAFIASLSDVEKMEDRTKALKAKIELAEKVAHLPDPGTLAQQIVHEPENLQLRQEYAEVLLAHGNFEDALEQYYTIMLKDRSFNDNAGQKGLISTFEQLGNSGELVSKYRRKMAALLF